MVKKRPSDYLITLHAALLNCNRCGWWTGWKSSKERGVKRIDTICGVCGCRLRHSERRPTWTWEQKTIAPANASGSGFHRKDRSSVSRARTISDPSVTYRFIKKEASKKNKEIQKAIFERDGPINSDFLGPSFPPDKNEEE
jgi:hypothetical protein